MKNKFLSVLAISAFLATYLNVGYGYPAASLETCNKLRPLPLQEKKDATVDLSPKGSPVGVFMILKSIPLALTKKQIAKKLELSPNTILSDLSNLIGLGLIIKEGRGDDAEYELTKPARESSDRILEILTTLPRARPTKEQIEAIRSSIEAVLRDATYEPDELPPGFVNEFGEPVKKPAPPQWKDAPKELPRPSGLAKTEVYDDPVPTEIGMNGEPVTPEIEVVAHRPTEPEIEIMAHRQTAQGLSSSI